jgi:hypothetical protein
MARSSRLFLIGLLVACGVEVLAEWNQTLLEINVLRNAVRQKGENYVGIIGKAGDDELAAADRAGLERLTHGIFDDEDAVYVRFTDAKGAVVWDRLKPDFEETLRRRGYVEPFARRYARLMDRDTDRALHDPAALARQVANSKYKDLAQAWTDATARAVAAFAPPKPPPAARGVVVYQDRLHDENHAKDDRTSYAIGTVLGEDGKDLGTVLVAFDMERTNAAVRFKYVKFAALCSFFVALILVQNVVSRRNKLWQLDLQARYADAKRALREAMPADDIRCGALSANGAVHQARGSVDGMVWSAADEGGSLLVLVVDPDGDGVDAAAVGLHVSRVFLARRREGIAVGLDEELRALGEAAAGIPLTRPLDALLVRVDARSGAYAALGGPIVQLRVVGGVTFEAPELRPSDGEAPGGIVGPLFRASGVLEPGTSIVAVLSDTSRVDPRAFGDAIARFLSRAQEPGKAIAVDDAATWARGRTAPLAESDIAVVAVTRA